MSGDKPKRYINAYAKYSGIAFQMFATVGISIWGGIKLDEYIESMKFPLFTVLFAFISVIGSMILIIKQLPKE